MPTRNPPGTADHCYEQLESGKGGANRLPRTEPVSQASPASRREFLAKSSLMAAAATIVPRHVLGGPGHVAPSDRVNVALVGAGGRGLQNARELMKLPDVRISAVADPAEHWDLSNYYYRGVAGRVPSVGEIETHYQASEPSFRCQQFSDYREMIEDDKSAVDAVLCATPDHLHAHVSISSMLAGKHIYCEKPLTHSIAEARLVARIARETGVATQMGNQGHSSDTIREAVELLRAGAIGDVDQVHAWVQTSRWNSTLDHPPAEGQVKPSGIDWDLWCGPRQPVAFHSAYAPVSWRDFWQFGSGALGDMGCHDLDSTVWAFNLDHPNRVEFFGGGDSDDGMAPYSEAGYYEFSRGSDQPPLTLNWYSGGIKPRTPDALPADVRLPNRGAVFVGSRGVMLCGGAGRSHAIYPRDVAESVQTPEPTIARSAGHHRDWVDAIKGGEPPSSNFEYGAKLTEIVLLGVLALRTGKPILWDASSMKAIGTESESASMIREDYRDGWGLDF